MRVGYVAVSGEWRMSVQFENWGEMIPGRYHANSFSAPGRK